MSSRAATFALLNRALREDNRLKQTYAARGGLVCFVFFLLFTTQNRGSYSGAPGLTFFSEIAWLNLWFISITGLSYFAAAVAEEKEETTLGLLRMTNLGSLTILLGKSTSRLLGVALLICVQLPFTMLAVTLGGVSVQQILAGYITLGTYIFFLCNLALIFSVLFNRVGTATAATAVALFAFFVVPSLGEACLRGLIYAGAATTQTAWVRGTRWLLASFAAASPVNRLSEIASIAFSGAIFGYQACADIILGIICFGIAWAGFDRFTRERREAGGTVAGSGGSRRLFRLWMWKAGRPWRLAVVWKDFYLYHGGLSMFVIQLVGYSVLAGVLWYSHVFTMFGIFSSQHLAEIGGTLCWLFLLICACVLAIGCARIFRVEIQGKTLSGLVGVPTSLSWIAWQKVGALLLSLVPAAAFALGSFVLYAVNTSRSLDSFINADFGRSGIEGVLATSVQFVLFLYVTAYFSLRLKRLALPLALTACFVGNMLAVWFMASMFFSSGTAEFSLFFYHIVLVGVIIALNFLIDTRLRALAAEES